MNNFDLSVKWPWWIDIKQSIIEGSGMWAFSKINIKPNLTIWEYIWHIVSSDQFDNKRWYNHHWFSVRKWHKVIFVIDSWNKKHSNWTRYINCARHSNEENLKFFQYKQRIYVKTIKPVKAWEELLIWYGYEYWEKLLWYNIYD